MLPRPPRVPSDCYGTRSLACLAILGAVPLFFYAYDAIAHREPPFTPVLGANVRHLDQERFQRGPFLAVDMYSHSIGMAMADVPLAKLSRVESKQPARVRDREKKPIKVAAAPRRHRTVSSYPDARNAFAQAPGFGWTPFGGF